MAPIPNLLAHDFIRSTLVMLDRAMEAEDVGMVERLVIALQIDLQAQVRLEERSLYPLAFPGGNADPQAVELRAEHAEVQRLAEALSVATVELVERADQRNWRTVRMSVARLRRALTDHLDREGPLLATLC